MSTVILDTITGKSTATTITIGSTPVVSASANSMTIRGEGSAQTSIQQGLAKAHCHWDSNSTIVTGFNISSIDDDGLGDWDLNYTNNFGGTDNIISTAADNSFQSSNVCYNTVGGNTASDTTIFGLITTGGNKDVSTYVTVDGDLA